MSHFISMFKRLFRQPGFIAAFAVLLLAAVGLNATTQYLQLHFKKLPVPLAHSLEMIPETLGKWICVSKDQVTDDVQQELGTNMYIMRFYINSEVVEKDDIAVFAGKDSRARIEYLSKLREKYKNRFDRAVISFAVTYYTGKADTVAHIPERCYTADGYEPTETQTERWHIGLPSRPDGDMDVRYISFEDQVSASRVTRNVAYFFQTNGEYTSDPTVVRLKLQDLFRKHAYYSKIELMIQDKEREESAAAMRDFLTAAMPEVEKCLPNWSAVGEK